MAETASSFLRLPTEIRLQIYSYLLVPEHGGATVANGGMIQADYHISEKSAAHELNDANVLHVRLVDPQGPNASWLTDTLSSLKRSKCFVRTDRFRARTMQTTYTAMNNPGIEPAILAVCKLVYAEAAEILYTRYTFDFDTHVEAIGSFLADLTPLSKGYIRSVSLVKRATPYDREFDRCEWNAATSALCHLPSLRKLDLGVVAGKPGLNGWENVPEWSKQDFEAMVRWRQWAEFEWVKELARVNLKDGGEVKVRAIVEHCPMPGSESMTFWVGVSRNVEGGFGEWVKDLILSPA